MLQSLRTESASLLILVSNVKMVVKTVVIVWKVVPTMPQASVIRTLSLVIRAREVICLLSKITLE
jgi:hypothetical protein